VGRPHPGVEVKVCEPGTLNEVDLYEIGEIVVRVFPSSLILHGDARKNQRRYLGWLISIDYIVEVDEERNVSFLGRGDDGYSYLGLSDWAI
jgi:acyl-coenzyme A synthetase/AMP-(fatty) acid ligase